MGYLIDDLKRLCQGDPERFVFQVETHPEWGRKTALGRDDRDILEHFLRPAAESLGFYWIGFGWHSLRREAVISLGAILGPNATMRLAGHSTADMNLLYTLADQQAQDAAIRQKQETLIGKAGEKLQ